jgi:hypothetical protein
VTRATFGASDKVALDRLFETWANQLYESSEAFVQDFESVVLKILRQPYCWHALDAVASSLINLARQATSPARLEKREIDSLVLHALPEDR